MPAHTNVWELVPEAPGTPLAKVGGLPQPVGRLEWPVCASCGGPMRFLFQLPHLPGRLDLGPFAAVYVFHCENPKKVCYRWLPDRGANRAVGVVAGTPELIGAPTTVAPYPESALALRPAPEQAEGPASKVGGEPDWLQDPATVDCDGKPVSFVAQLDAEPFGLDFGDGGRGYLLRCTEACAHPFRFLAQSF